MTAVYKIFFPNKLLRQHQYLIVKHSNCHFEKGFWETVDDFFSSLKYFFC